MTVTFEALDARQGDALLVRFEHDGEPVLWVIDGGPSGVYEATLGPRLAEIHDERGLGPEEPLPLDLVLVTHIDGDHVVGITKLFEAQRDAETHDTAKPYRVARAWHNSFQRLVDSSGAVPAALEALAGGHQDDGVVAVIASARQGARLADLIRAAGLDGNPPFAGLVQAPRVLEDGLGGATVTVVGPTHAQLVKLADQYEKELEQPVDRGDLAEAATYTDNTASNLSSIALHVAIEGKTLFLTGDGRGDHLLEGLEEAGLLDEGGRMHVDLLKVPHHGSDRNLEIDFFERVVADHYVISADGQHHNPSTDVLEWIVSTQEDRDYTVHLTYADGNDARATLEAALDGATNATLRWREPGARSLAIEL